MEKSPYSYFWWCGYSEVPRCHLSSQWVSQKLLQRLVPHELKDNLPDFDVSVIVKDLSQLTLKNSSFQWFIFVEYQSSFESNSPGIFPLCETKLDDSTDSGNFLVRCCLPFIWKDSVTHIHCLVIYVRDGLLFSRDISLENSADSYLYFRLDLLQSVFYFFSLNECKHFIRLWAQILMLFHLT